MSALGGVYPLGRYCTNEIKDKKAMNLIDIFVMSVLLAVLSYKEL